MQGHKFTLAGQQFELCREDVERKLRHVAPSAVRKYSISVHGRRYPVKQAIEAATGLATDRFISTDAARILRALGFEIEHPERDSRLTRTESELLFEEYLRSHALGYFEFEPELASTSARPDYRLVVRGNPILFEVKEFRPDPALFRNNRVAAYDPYVRIREKIEAARKKFKDVEEFPCCLVLYNSEHPLVDLASWEIMYGAMLGNLGISFPVDTSTGIGDPDRTSRVFGAGGKMLRYSKEGEAVRKQNTTVSAIVVLQHLGLGLRRLSSYIDRLKLGSDSAVPIEKIWQITQESVGTERDPALRQLRVIVYENPFARKPLNREIFREEYDERYGAEDGKVLRLYAGVGILELEAEEARSCCKAGSNVFTSPKENRSGDTRSGDGDK